MNILLSIKPEFVKDIFEGEKLFEYRRSIFKMTDISKVVVYATMPVGKIVGEFRIERIIEDSPQEIWRKTSKVSGLSKNALISILKVRKLALPCKLQNHAYTKNQLILGFIMKHLSLLSLFDI